MLRIGPILGTAVLKILPTWSNWKSGYSPPRVSQFSHSFEASLALPHCPLGLGSWVCAHILSFRPRVSQTAENSGTPNHLNFWTQYKTRDLAWKLWSPMTLGTLSFNLENNTLGGEHSHFYLWGIETEEVEITLPRSKLLNWCLNPGLWLQCLIFLYLCLCFSWVPFWPLSSFLCSQDYKDAL